jgi:hypothetical protein
MSRSVIRQPAGVFAALNSPRRSQRLTVSVVTCSRVAVCSGVRMFIAHAPMIIIMDNSVKALFYYVKARKIQDY